MSRRDAQGTVYLLHFSEPYKHARHYTSNGPRICPRAWRPTATAAAPG
jgi:hypothetical protein